MNLEMQDHVAVVTGGASGIGAAIAAAFQAEGCRVVLWDLSPRVEEAAAKLGGDCVGIRVDVVDPASVAAALKATIERCGPIDHLAHAAAIGSGKFGFPFTNLSPTDWPKVLEVNIMGMVQVAHAVAPLMVERKSGTMIFIASVAGQIGSPTDPPYSASKAANINFAQCMAKDLAPHGVRVNTVCPGMVKTPLNQAVWQSWHDRQPPEKRKTYDEWADEKIKSVIPLGTWQKVEDVADLAVFLSSARSAQITGQTVNVDGGFVMHW